MDAVDWTALGALSAIFLGGLAWLRHQVQREIDVVRSDIREVRAEILTLNERYVRHLEAHAAGGGSGP